MRAELKMQVVNRSQQVYTAGLNPMANYSRVIAVHAAAAGGGVHGFGYSQTLAKDLWLLRIDVTVQVGLGGDFQRTHFSLHRGGVIPARYQDIMDWDHLIDFGTYAGFHGMVVYGAWRQFTFHLSRKFMGEANRMGVLMFNAGVGAGVVHAFFTVSEG